MADGQPGELGAVVVEPAEAEHKHACVLAAIPHQPAVVPFVKDLVLKLNLAIKMAVQVSSFYEDDTDKK